MLFLRMKIEKKNEINFHSLKKTILYFFKNCFVFNLMKDGKINSQIQFLILS